jgi:hypothetical protein
MNRADEVFALFVDANPVADPATAADRPRLELLPSLEGSNDMQTQQEPIRIDPSPRPPLKKRWLIPTLAAAAVVVVAVVIGASVLSTSDDPLVDVVARPNCRQSRRSRCGTSIS